MSQAGREFTAAEKTAGWPEVMRTSQLALLQRPYNYGDRAGRMAQQALLDALNADCEAGTIECRTETKERTATLTSQAQDSPFASREWQERDHKLGRGFVVSDGRISAITPETTQIIKTHYITAPVFAAWLDSQGEVPGRHIAAWFSAQGMQSFPKSALETGKPTFGLLTPHPQRSGEYLRTLHEWGELPEVVPLPNLANLLAALCNQNEAALLKVLSNAVLNQEVEFYGQSHHGGWIPDMVRVWHAVAGKPRVRPATETKAAELTQAFNPNGRLHVEAMGMRPQDAVALLAKRGRKIPDELRSILPQNEESKPLVQPGTQSMNRTLFHAEIADREFGSYLLQVGALLTWLQTNSYHLDTQPPLADFDFVQVEALLCAIERAATKDLTYEQAEMLVQADPELSKDRAASAAPVWLIGAYAHQKWRSLITDATAQGELVLLEFASKLPVRQVGGAIPEPVQGAGAKVWTPEKLTELQAYRRQYGTKKAAKHYQISEQRIRQLLPSDKPKAKGYSAFTHHIK